MRSQAKAPSSGATAAALTALWLASAMLWWGFAFFPLSLTSPEWIARARFACFGMTPNGLPAPYGWMLLILGPGLLAAVMLAGFSREMREGTRLLKRSLAAQAVATLVVGALAWETTWVAAQIRKGVALSRAASLPATEGALPESYPRSTNPAPDFSLVDQYGSTVSLETLKGKSVVLTFVFAHCQTMCPMLVRDAKLSLERLPSDRVAAVLITLDPWRDTPRALPSMARKWQLTDRRAHLLSGAVPEVTAVLDRYQVPWKRDEKTGDVEHPGLVYVLDPAGRIAYAFNNPPVEWIVEAVGRALR